MPSVDDETPGRLIPDAIRTLLNELGEDPERAGLVGTPDRVRRMYAELTDG
jgi:GTP cyclohydrolase I